MAAEGTGSSEVSSLPAATHAVQYVAFEIGRGGPRGERVPAAILCARWNAWFRESGHGLAIRTGWGSTGNYVLDSTEVLTVGLVSTMLDRLPGSRPFVLFSAPDFRNWLSRFEAHLGSAARPQVPPGRRPNPGAMMNRDVAGNMPPHLPAPDPRRDPVEDAHAWTSGDFVVARMRGVWKNDLLGSDGRTLDRARREGTWGALAVAMGRVHGGQWTARAISTLKGIAQSLDEADAELLHSRFDTKPVGGLRVDLRVDRTVRDNRETILDIAAKHGATNVRIFGSVARGTTTSTSDLDLLVDAGPNRSPFFPGGLIAELEAVLGVRVDVLTENALHWYIRERILREAVPL